MKKAFFALALVVMSTVSIFAQEREDFGPQVATFISSKYCNIV